MRAAETLKNRGPFFAARRSSIASVLQGEILHRRSEIGIRNGGGFVAGNSTYRAETARPVVCRDCYRIPMFLAIFAPIDEFRLISRETASPITPGDCFTPTVTTSPGRMAAILASRRSIAAAAC
jgi:hypothetical protein